MYMYLFIIIKYMPTTVRKKYHKNAQFYESPCSVAYLQLKLLSRLAEYFGR